MRIFTEKTVAVVINTMLYCPKCQQTFAENGQRFCPNDDTRLLSETSAEHDGNQNDGVFTNILNRRADEESGKFSSVPKFSQIEPKFSRLIKPIGAGNVFDSDSDFELELELEPPSITEKKSEQTTVTEEPIAESNDSDSDDSPLAADETVSTDNQIYESGSTTEEAQSFDRSSPENFVGQTAHDRYRIAEFVEENDGEIIYLAKDKNLAGKTVVFRILPEADDSFIKSIFAEERIALARLNHPNIADVIESGELSDEAAYLVSESVEGETLKDYLERGEKFNQLWAARVVRQAAEALSEAHLNGVLHRNLKPENIVLNLDENGVERVKLINFGAAEKLDETNLLYKSPEQVEGKITNISSDNYALAVIAYQLLTNRLPFNASSVEDLLKAQREGLNIRPSDIQANLPPIVDTIIKKALSFNSFDRYQKAQTFGDEFFGEIFAVSPASDKAEIESPSAETETETPAPPISKPVPVIEPKAAGSSMNFPAQTAKTAAATDGGVKATEDLAWEKRSPEPPNEPSASRNLFSILGVVVLLAALFGVWYYFINRPSESPVISANESANRNAAAPIENAPIAQPNANLAAPTAEEIEAPPSPRSITQPRDTLYFQNSREELKGDLMKNFLGFSLYYPQNWRRNDAPKNFLDISKNAPNNLPVEQMLVTFYNSKGTFKEDSAAIFPAQIKETNESLKKILPNYQMISEGRKTVNNGWQAYEIQFQGTGKAGGEEITIWGKRLFIPTAVRGMKNGYVVTMLATSLSPDVKSVEDVGVRGELASILETFEPNQSF